MYRVKFLERIDTSGMEPVKQIHTTDYGEGAIVKRASHFKSMGFKGVISVKCGKEAKLTPEKVLDLFYPEFIVIGGNKITISPEDKEIKKAALNASLSKDKGDDDNPKGKGTEKSEERLALEAEAKELGIKVHHMAKDETIRKKIEEKK